MKRNQLITILDTNIAIQDDVVIHSLERIASPYMKNNTTHHFKQEQNQINS